MRIRSIYLKSSLIAVPMTLILIAAACGGGVSEESVRELEEKIAALEGQIAELEATQSHEATEEMPTPTPDSMIMEMAPVQEIAIIENYAATRFFPGWIVVIKDIPVRLHLTRLHREHVNRFTIEPFFSSSEVILPGEIGVIEFLPDQAGEFKISNVGHSFDATLVVAETQEEANRLAAERGVQMFALIHSIDDFRIFPNELVIQQGIPTTIHNISLIGEHRVSFEPFHVPDDLNIRPREITPIQFTPASTGEFTIRHEIHGFTGSLVVEEGNSR